jgi:hypothetical protein
MAIIIGTRSCELQVLICKLQQIDGSDNYVDLLISMEKSINNLKGSKKRRVLVVQH